MKTHFDHLLEHVPDLSSRTILDVGSGRGSFIVDAACRGARIVGLEPHGPYRQETKTKAEAQGITAEVVPGNAEHLPFPDASFGFVNMSEVIEHVEDPRVVLSEAYRVLEKEGYAYVSVPNRFGFRDPHYHLYLVNWLPRSIAERVITIAGKEKHQTESTGRQRLSDMHYMTALEAVRLFSSLGFTVRDIRELKLQKLPSVLRVPAFIFYAVARFFYFDSFHFLLKKEIW